MNRWLMGVVLGLTVAGCAAGDSEPLPAPPPDPVQKQVPKTPLAGELPDPLVDVHGAKITSDLDLPAVPREPLPQPGPSEEPAAE